MWSQLARLKLHRPICGKRMLMNAEHLGPMNTFLESASEELKLSGTTNTHWTCKGKRSVAIAVQLLEQNEIIAVPTDTIYGLAGVVARTSSIKKLYEIKERNENKPLCICVSKVEDIKTWGEIDHLSPDFLSNLLPGPYTIVLKRTPALNPDLNPGVDTVGIRVPRHKFVNCVSEMIGPIALTSANISNEPSCLTTTEFKQLWPKLGGIFYDQIQPHDILRKGSTIVDLSHPGCYKMIRQGVGIQYLHRVLQRFGLKKIQPDSSSN